MRPIDSSTQKHALLKEEQRSVPASTQTRGLGRTFLALHHRNYRLYFFGQMISLVGTWMQTTAQAWLVLQLTHSALLLGVVSLLQYLSAMIFSLYGGVLADRVPKRTLLLVIDINQRNRQVCLLKKRLKKHLQSKRHNV